MTATFMAAKFMEKVYIFGIYINSVKDDIIFYGERQESDKR